MPEKLSAEETILQAQEARRGGEQRAICLPHADLSGLHLPGGDLVGADLEGADLTGAILAGAQLARANLKNAVLIGASLDGADLTGTDLRGADLAGARLDDAVLASARLEGACLQAVFGDPLSMNGARMDQITIELSEFTMRDIAQMVVRGVDVKENETVPVSLRPERVEATSIPSILPLVSKEPSLPKLSGTPRIVDSRQPIPVRKSSDAMPDLPSAAPVPGGLDLEGVHDDPVSSKEVLEPIDFDRPLSSIPDIRRALGSIPPSAPQPAPISSRAPSLPPPSRSPSIIPSFRAAEISMRNDQVDSDQEQMPVSQRMFLQLNDLIDNARLEAAPPVSLRPQQQRVKKLTTEFEFPMPGDDFLGVAVEDELPRGTTSRSFLGRTADGEEVVVRIFDPHCDGAALQLPAFQRGLRALNKLQCVDDPDLAVVELVSVAVDQTAYVVKRYKDQSLQELLEVSMSLEDGLNAIASLAQTMNAIHRQGVMVRSWKPSNVLVDRGRLLLSEPDMVHLPTLSQVRGDAGGYKAYAAPEELLGRGTRSPTADVFSLGKMLEFLLTGQEPLVPLGSPPLIATRENVPAVLVELVKRATAPEPSDRYQQVGELLDDLTKFQVEGDRAVLLASLRPTVVSQLSVPPMSTGPAVPDVNQLIRKKIEIRKAEREESRKVEWERQAEIGAAIIGGLGGIAVLALLVLAPRSVDSMEGMTIYLAAGVGMLAFALPVPSVKRLPYRLATWFALSALIWLVDPIQFAHLTWGSRLKSGTELQKQEALKNLSRVGKKSARGVNLDGIRFSQFDLDSLDFTGASLKGADFSRAFLVEAVFDSADVTDANFEGANLFGASFRGTSGLEDAQCDQFTILPREISCDRGYISDEPQEFDDEPDDILTPTLDGPE